MLIELRDDDHLPFTLIVFSDLIFMNDRHHHNLKVHIEIASTNW